MTESFDVQLFSQTLGTIGTDTVIPSFYVPASGGRISILEGWMVCGTETVCGTVNLVYGTAPVGTGITAGTVVPLGTIGASLGSGGLGTFEAMKIYPFTLTSNAIPVGYWVGVAAQTEFSTAALSTVYIAYVNGVRSDI
jgi:hypothetical protein